MLEASQKEIREYLTVESRSPFADWLNALRNTKARAKIRVRLDRLRLGNMGDCKSVRGGVHELRIDFGPGYRVYFGQDQYITKCRKGP